MIKYRLQLFFSFLIIVTTVIWAGYFNENSADQNKDLKVYFLDVGQGDSEYIKIPGGYDILIDGGPDNKVLNELGKVMEINDHEINLIVLTHPHADHITGLIDILDRYKVDEIWESGVDYPSAIYDAFKSKIKEKNISDIDVIAEEQKNINNVQFKVIYPLSSLQNKTINNINNSSVITKLNYNKFNALFLGDAEKDTQKQILNKLSTTTVVKVAHHGSINGLFEDLYKITRPAIAIISVGVKNTYGHPAPSTIKLLQQYAIRIYRTDQNSTIEIDSDGVNYSVK